MADQMDWIEIQGGHGSNFKTIGAIGFIGDKAVAIAAFYEDADVNKDGKVTLTERLMFHLPILSASKGGNVLEVARNAQNEYDVYSRDPHFGQYVAQRLVQFGSNMIIDGVYRSYFALGVSMTGKGIAEVITQNRIKQFVIQKGCEALVRKAFDAAITAVATPS